MMYTIDRVNRLREHFGLHRLSTPIGGSEECDEIDRLAGFESHGARDYETRYSLHRGHMRAPNAVGYRLSLLEIAVFGRAFPICSPSVSADQARMKYEPWKPSNTFWLGMDGLTVKEAA